MRLKLTLAYDGQTSAFEIGQVVTGQTSGAVGTISKPFSPRDLPEQLRAIWAKLP